MQNVIPDFLFIQLKSLAKKFQNILEDNFVGFYLHGSLAMGCFNFEESDIDFLVVVNNNLTKLNIDNIVKLLLDSSTFAPQKGFEMSIIKKSVLENFQHPTPFEFHFSNAHLVNYKENTDYLCGKFNDPDLAAHFMITKKRGLCLLGESIESVFPSIPEDAYLDSILLDLNESLENSSFVTQNTYYEVPTYLILNACRIIAYLREKKIMSKFEGGNWGLTNLPFRYKPLIKQALNKYSSKQNERILGEIIMEFCNFIKECVISK
jgi:streptomycin 3"-adenylyltransferase